MRRMPRSHRRAGFWLVELLFVIGILGVVAITAGRLFSTTIRLGQDAAAAQNRAATLDSISAALRTDMWSVSKFDVADGRTATLHLADNRTITWSIADEQLTRQETDGPPRHWPIVKDTTFAADGALLILRLPASKTSVAGEARFAGESQLIGRLTR